MGLVAMGAIFVINGVITWFTFRKIDRSTAVNRTICLMMGMPMLQAVERGNLLMLAYTFVVLAFGPLLGSARLRLICAGIAINFKLYLIGAVLAHLLKGRWKWVELALISAILVYLLTFAIYGSGSPWEIAENLQSYQGGQARSILDTWFAATYDALLSAIEGGTFPLAAIIGSKWADRLEIILPALRLFSQLIIMAAAVAIWLRPAGISPQRASLLALLFIFISTESGIYILLFLSFFILQERWRGFGRIWAICACYLLAIPVDFALDTLSETPREAYFWDSMVMFGTMIPVGPLVRPIAIMSIAWAIALMTLNEVRIGIRMDRLAAYVLP